MTLVAAGWYCFKDDFLVDSESLEPKGERSKLLAVEKAIPMREEKVRRTPKPIMAGPKEGSERTPITTLGALTKFCRYCGAKIPEDSVYCEKCGAKLIQVEAPETQLCSTCSSVLPRGAQFCDECGAAQ